MNPVKHAWMKVRGTLSPPEDYFANNADAPEESVKRTLRVTKATGRRASSVASGSGVPHAVYVDLCVEDGQANATTSFDYDLDWRTAIDDVVEARDPFADFDPATRSPSEDVLSAEVQARFSKLLEDARINDNLNKTSVNVTHQSQP